MTQFAHGDRFYAVNRAGKRLDLVESRNAMVPRKQLFGPDSTVLWAFLKACGKDRKAIDKVILESIALG